MFKLVAYKYGRLYGIKTGKDNVLSMLIQETGKPDKIVYHKKSVSLYYHDDKFTERYTIPVEYWTGEH